MSVSQTITFAPHLAREMSFKMKYDRLKDIDGDWDNLIILDACRYDVFAEHSPFESTCKPVMLKSSQSMEFCKNYFCNRDFHDTVYVTANPYGAQLQRGIFHDIVPTFQTSYDSNKEKEQVQDIHQNWGPEKVFNTAISAYKDYSNKRLIIHFMQPHAPYYGDRAQELRNNLKKEGYQFWAWDEDIDRKMKKENDNIMSHLLTAAKRGKITTEELRDIYIENLQVVFPYVKQLLEALDGKTIITSDHGEMLGEPKRFFPKSRGHLSNYIGHEKGLYSRELREVPWLIISGDKKRDIISEPPIKAKQLGGEQLNEQLRALGYK